MKLPPVREPGRFVGLYVIDFGESTCLGYTADEVAMLMESERYRHGKVYRIARASPDGRFELIGVAPSRFQFESGMFFYRRELAEAQRDFADLLRLAEQRPAPCRAKVQLADLGEANPAGRYVLALIYPAEAEPEVSAWLLAGQYMGGETAEGGVSLVTNYYEQSAPVLERAQLLDRSGVESRSREEVLASVGRPVQRFAS